MSLFGMSLKFKSTGLKKRLFYTFSCENHGEATLTLNIKLKPCPAQCSIKQKVLFRLKQGKHVCCLPVFEQKCCRDGMNLLPASLFWTQQVLVVTSTRLEIIHGYEKFNV